MRRITITITEVPERQETETFADFGDEKAASFMENRRVNAIIPGIMTVLSHGFKGIAVDNSGKSIEQLRKEARLGIDIREAGE